jgi:hypothetical protein
MKILLCLAGEQLPANTLPLESPDIRPDVVYVAVTKGKKEKGLELIEQIKAMGIKTECLDVPNENSLHDMNLLFENWLLTHDTDNIIVNITGGNKIMSLAAYQVFNGFGFRCFYQTLQPNQLVWLDDESVISNVGEKIKLDRYLAQYQFKVKTKIELAEVPQTHKKYAHIVFKELKKNYDSTCKIISKLNAHTAKKPLTPAELKRFSFLPEEELFLQHLSHETDIFKLKGKAITTDSENDRQLVNGGWLEVLCADLMRAMESVRDISVSVEIYKSTQRAKASTNQELDVMAMLKQKLLIAECKTVNWKNTDDSSQAIYKLSALSDIGGLNTKATFISLYNLSDATKTRAAEHSIHIICGKDITSLDTQLLNWGKSI